MNAHWTARLTDVGARHGGRLVLESTLDTACEIAAAGLLCSGVELHPTGAAARLRQLDAAADELAIQINGALERALTAEHQLAALARLVLDDDLVAARDYLTELGFGLTHGEEVLRGATR